MTRILMLCTRFPLGEGDEYLTNELAHALARQGDEVSVVVIDWDAVPGTPSVTRRLDDSVVVLAVAPRTMTGLGPFVAKASKWVLSSFAAMREVRRSFGDAGFDLLIAFSPATVVAAQFIWCIRRFRPRSYFVLWDFFPFHQRSIGLLPGGLVFAVARGIEGWLIRRFDTIGCMSSLNVAYLKSHYRLRAAQRVEVLPIWGDITPPPVTAAAAIRAAFDLPPGKKIIVFGGQITEGRGVEDVLAAARLAAGSRPDLVFLLIGSGRLAGLVADQAAAADGGNIIYRPRVARRAYLGLLGACDVGLVCTVRDVDVPTFPSKLIDYLRAGLPVVASVEASTDFGDFVVNRNLGLSVLAGDAEALLRAVCTLVDQPGRRTDAALSGRRALEEVFDVNRIAVQISRPSTGEARSSLDTAPSRS